MAEKFADRTVFSLVDVARSIQKTIANRYQRTYWIKAEINKLNLYSHSGHAFPELVEKKDGKIIAEMRSIIWSNDLIRINKSFVDLLGEPLKDGITVVFEAGISYDPLYGFSLKIIHIDPTFTLGELEREKRETIKRLKEENLFSLNKQKEFPLLPKKIAIISVESSKGLSDFYNILEDNPWGYRFHTTLFPAVLQGDKSPSSIINQLIAIAKQTEDFDVVAIIRGGGGEVGLSSYNKYPLAKAISLFPIPVLTGIGHSTNETVSEMVAYQNAITPSKLADIFIQHFHQFALQLQKFQSSIALNSGNYFNQQKQQLDNWMRELHWSSLYLLKNKQQRTSSLTDRLATASKQLLENRHLQLQGYNNFIKIANPKSLLQRGFSITYKHGEIVKNATNLKNGDPITTKLKNGSFTAIVKKD